MHGCKAPNHSVPTAAKKLKEEPGQSGRLATQVQRLDIDICGSARRGLYIYTGFCTSLKGKTKTNKEETKKGRKKKQEIRSCIYRDTLSSMLIRDSDTTHSVWFGSLKRACETEGEGTESREERERGPFPSKAGGLDYYRREEEEEEEEEVG